MCVCVCSVLSDCKSVVKQLDWALDGTRLLSLSDNNTVHVWRMKVGYSVTIHHIPQPSAWARVAQHGHELLSMGTGCSAWARVAQHGHGLLSMGTGCSAWARVAQHGHGLLSMGTG